MDKGANSPNLFVDPKSAESGLPPFSDGARDDLGQRTCLEAVLDHFADPAANPTSSVYHAPMMQSASAWCWDARPFPDFPARSAVWADAPNWTLGHWLTGRVGVGSGEALAGAILARYGVTDADLSGASGTVDGYVIAQPCTGADALAPLAAALAFDGAEREGALALVATDGTDPDAPMLGDAELALPDDSAAASLSRTLSPTPDLVRVRFIDGGSDYQSGSATVHADAAGGAGPLDLSLPVVMGLGQAEGIAAASLARAPAGRDTAVVQGAPLTVLRAEPGDLVRLAGAEGVWKVERADVDDTPRLTLSRVSDGAAPAVASTADPVWRPAPAARPGGPPVFQLMDLPPLDGFEDDSRPVIAAAADPWRPLEVSGGPSADSLSLRAQVADPAVVGVLTADLPPGPVGRWDEATALSVQIEGGLLASATDEAVLGGANVLAVLGASGEWEVLQFAAAQATGPGAYTLTRLLRAQLGTDPAMFAGAMSGAPVVVLTSDLARAQVSASERMLAFTWRAGAAGATPLAIAAEDFTWTGLAYRPFSPAHLFADRRGDGGVDLSWIRRTRVHGDGWDADEVPLSEESEAYACDVLAGDGVTVLRSFDTTAPSQTYDAASVAADFPAGPPDRLTLRVRQRSAIYGLGAPLQRTLWL